MESVAFDVTNTGLLAHAKSTTFDEVKNIIGAIVAIEDEFLITTDGIRGVEVIQGHEDVVIAVACDHNLRAFTNLNQISTRTGNHLVVTSTGSDEVVAVANSDGVITECGVDEIVAVASLYLVIASTSVDRVIAVADDDQIITSASTNFVVAVVCKDTVITVFNTDGVVTTAAKHGVIAVTGVGLIVAGAEVDQVVATGAIDIIITDAGVDGVVTQTGPDNIISSFSGNAVVATEAINKVITTIGNDRVVAEAGDHKIISLTRDLIRNQNIEVGGGAISVEVQIVLTASAEHFNQVLTAAVAFVANMAGVIKMQIGVQATGIDQLQQVVFVGEITFVEFEIRLNTEITNQIEVGITEDRQSQQAVTNAELLQSIVGGASGFENQRLDLSIFGKTALCEVDPGGEVREGCEFTINR